MANVLIVYYSRTGNTKKMAEFVAEGVRDAGAEPVVLPVEKATVDQLADSDGVIIGTPTYYGHCAAPIRGFLDRSVRYHGQLDDKVGGAFASSHNIGGGNETAILSILHSLLVHGMIVQGAADGDHYGPVAIGSPDRRAEAQCRELGRRVSDLIKRLHG